MTVVFYHALSRLMHLKQVPIRSAFMDKVLSKNVRKICPKRALTAHFSAFSCAGLVGSVVNIDPLVCLNSRIIREAVDAGRVRPVDPNTSERYMKYVPFWA